MRTMHSLYGAAFLMLALKATAANAALISGSIGFTGGFDNLVDLPASSVVSGLSAFDVQGVAQAFGAVGDLTGTGGEQSAFDFDINALPTAFFLTDTGFSFRLNSARVSSIAPLYCNMGICSDSIELSMAGVVSAIGFDDTLFVGNWVANGVCLGADAECASLATANWSAALVILAEAPVSQPSVAALLGLGLAGLLWSGRKKVQGTKSGR